MPLFNIIYIKDSAFYSKPGLVAEKLILYQLLDVYYIRKVSLQCGLPVKY
jgi:hypothetical protein